MDYTVALDSGTASVNSNGYADNYMIYSPTAAGCAGLFANIMSNAPQTVAASGSTQVTSSLSCTDTPCYIAQAWGANNCVWTLNNSTCNFTYNIYTGGIALDLYGGC